MPVDVMDTDLSRVSAGVVAVNDGGGDGAGDGSIIHRTNIVTKAAGGAVTAAEIANTFVRVTGVAALTLPDPAGVGSQATFCSTTAAVFSLDPAHDEYIIMPDGTTLAIGNKVSSSGVANECITIICDIANYWRIIGAQGLFSDGGA